MKLWPISVCLLALGAYTLGQDHRSAQSSGRAAIQGIVIKDPSSEPVNKVLVELIAENQTESGNYTATTDIRGSFLYRKHSAGRYRLFAERTGFLDIDKHHGRSEGRVFTLTGGQELKDLQIRLQAAAVLRGRVTDEDGDPLAGAEVTALRQTFASGHRHWEQVGSERTNDLGEFRIANLASGNVYVSVNPPPDFSSLIESGGAAKNSAAPDKPANSYQTTYYRELRIAARRRRFSCVREMSFPEFFVNAQSEFEYSRTGGESSSAARRRPSCCSRAILAL